MPKKSFDYYMAQLKVAEECPSSKRTTEQKKIIRLMSNGPSYNSLFGRHLKGQSVSKKICRTKKPRKITTSG